MLGLVELSGCQRIDTSSSESSTMSAESARAKTITALRPNTAATSSPGRTTAWSPVTMSRSTSDNSCHPPVLTEPNTAIAKTRASSR